MTIRTAGRYQKALELPSEAKILKACCRWLDLNHYCYWRNSIGPVMRGGGKHAISFSPNPMRGFPDLSGIIPRSGGRMWAAEVKTAKGKLSIYQVAWRDALTAAGVAYFVPRSVDELVAYLVDEELKETAIPASGAVDV